MSRMINARAPVWLLPPVGMLLAALLMWLIAQVLPTWKFPTGVRQSVIIALISSAVLLDFSGIWQFLAEKTGIIPFREQPKTLVTKGIYRFTRNPMYLGMVCWLLAWGMWLGFGIGWLSIAIFIFWLQYAYILPEEALLDEIFPKAYHDYRQTVPRWIFL